MKKFKLIAKFFFEQKCEEIWKFIKGIPIALISVFLLCVFSCILMCIAFGIGYILFLFAPDLRGTGEQLLKNCVAMGTVALVSLTFITVAVYKFINWIKENIELAKERAEEELGLTRYSGTGFDKESN